jgi:NhaA family Na+:H+ antiporter
MAVLVIAIFYTESISGSWLAGALVGLAAIVLMSRLGIRSVGMYIIAGFWVWLCTLQSGVHPTIAGVIVGLLTPVHPWLGGDRFLGFLRHTDDTLRKEETSIETARELVADLSFASREAVSPLFRVETALHPWVAFVIMPLFALANAGVPIQLDGIGEPVAVAVAAGLLFGKPIGIFGASWLAVRLGWAARPAGVTWPILGGAAFLGGIGFTMALFIASLGLSGGLLVSAKIGIILGSFVSAVLGMLILSAVAKKS